MNMLLNIVYTVIIFATAILLVAVNWRKKPLTHEDCVKIVRDSKPPRYVDYDQPVKVPLFPVRSIPAKLGDDRKRAQHRSHRGNLMRSKVVAVKKDVVVLRRGGCVFERLLSRDFN